MGDFKRFMEHVKKGNLDGVRNSFQPDFLEKEDSVKRRPIHRACRNGHLEVVQFLCEARCKLDCRTQGGNTPVQVARINGRKDCENYLNEILESRKIFDCVRRNDVPAFVTLYSPVIFKMKENGAGLSILEVAVQSKANEIIDYLNKLAKDKIFDCVRRNDVSAFVTLYSPAIFKMEENGTGLSILEVAVQSKANEIIDYLLDKLVNDEEISILEHYMKNCSRPDAVQLLKQILLYRSIRLYDANGFHLYCNAKNINEHGFVKTSFLKIASEFGCNPFIDAILKKSIYNEEEWTKAMDMATEKGHVGIADAISDRKRLLKKRADKNFTWLHSAVCDNDPDMVQYILERHLVNPDSNNEVVGTGLSLSHMMFHEKCIEVFENFNVDVNTQNKYLQSPLHEAIDSGMTDHCSYLISRADDIDKPGFMGFTGLQCAVIKGCEELCDDLVKKGADCVRYVEILQQTQINKAVLPISKSENAVTLCMKTHGKIYPCFLKKLNRNMIKHSDGDGNSLLHMAVKSLQPDLCKTLIKSGSNIDAINDQGNSPLSELFSPIHNQSDVEKAIATLNIFVESGIDVNTISKTGVTVLKGASKWNSERFMVSLLSNQSEVTCVTESDFKLAFTNHWFEYAETLISIMTEDCLKSVITDETFHLAMPHCDSMLLMSLFEKSTRTVQQLVIEDILDHFALKDEYEYFINLLKIEITTPKLFANGETLLTSLLKKRKLKFCWAIINCSTNKRCIVLANAIKETPLQISIETDLFDFMNPLIVNCDAESVQQFNWNDPLIPLFKKLSISNNNDMDQKLIAAIDAVIRRGGDIYKETPGGAGIINYCTRFRERIEEFQNNERHRERGENKICSVCLDMEVNCAFDCGHTFCFDCCEQLYRCPICNSVVTRRMKLYFN